MTLTIMRNMNNVGVLQQNTAECEPSEYWFVPNLFTLCNRQCFQTLRLETPKYDGPSVRAPFLKYISYLKYSFGKYASSKKYKHMNKYEHCNNVQ